VAIDVSKFIARFVEEARDHLATLNQGLGALAARPDASADIDRLFRAAHTIKGSARMLRLMPVSDTAHAIEDVLGALREQRLSVDAELIGLVQRALDRIAQAVDQLDAQPDPAQLPARDEALCTALSARASASPPPAPASAAPPPPAPEATPTTARAETVRVRLDHLDGLIHLMGEILARHDQLHERPAELRALLRALPETTARPCARLAHALDDDIQSQDVLIRQLHDRALALRMLPLSIIVEPAVRTLRELAHSIGKTMQCRVIGSDIELDRQLIDQLADPLIHLLRNAIDHGLEPPEERRAAGKPAIGQVQLRARQDGGWVVIEIEDDGRGIDLEAVRDKARRKGLLSAEQAQAAGERELIELIFTPGFSTAALITDLSGRGVGMDAVKASVVDQLHGQIQVDNQPGQGSRFSLRVPVSLAVMRVLLVEAGGQRVGFLAQHVAEIQRVVRTRLLEVADRQAVIVGNEFVPVLSLAELLGLETSGGKMSDSLVLVVLRIGDEKLALGVDDLYDERDLVVKPVPGMLRHLALLSGFVSSGHQALISVLHAPALLEGARRMRGLSQQPPATARSTEAASVARLLVVDDSLNTREIEKDLLEAHGYQVTLAEDGLDGLRKALSESFDAVLTDVEMPRMDGFTLTERLRAQDAYQSTPIIIVTSREKEQDKERGLHVGADAYIVKGDFDQNNLLSTLRALL
jgi:chemotaxis protein histidine kinase CheA